MKKASSFVLSLLLSSMGFAQEFSIPIWPGLPPLQQSLDLKEESHQSGILRISNVQIPAIEVFLPSPQLATGETILIFPGGGYSILAFDWEGRDIAKWLNSQGIAAMVLKYRLPNSPSLMTPEEVPLLDAQRAIRVIRHHASTWGIDPRQVGVMGFSAGGHLAASLSTQFAHELDRPKDAIDTLTARPDFSILIYPVITFTDNFSHSGSVRQLLGSNPSPEMITRFSNELNVTEKTPPTILIHAQDDQAVPVENSLVYFQALHKKGVPSALHIFPKGGHGFGFGKGKGSVENWRLILLDWLKDLSFP